MNCEQCESQLLSFLEEELPPDEAERARVHVAGCESCRSSLERLRTGQRLAARMPLESPDPDLDARVLEAARARAAERATTTAEASAPVEERPAETPDRANEDGGTFIDWLRGLTLGPQAAMATVMLLVVAIGLWYLPDLRKRPGAAGETVLHPEAGGEVAPTAEVEEPAEDPAPQQAPAAVEDRAAEADESRTAAAEPAPEKARQQARRRPAKRAKTTGEVEAESAGADEEAAPRPAGNQLAESGAGAVAADSPAPERRAARTRSARRERPQAMDSPTDEAVATRGEAPASLETARRLRSDGDCRRAVDAYERFFTDTPRHPQRPRAMLEAADCYERLNRLDRARHWLEQASSEPAVAPLARKRLRRLDSEPAEAATVEPSD